MDGRFIGLFLIVGLVPIAGCLGTGPVFGESCPAPELLVYHGDPGPVATAGDLAPVLVWSTHDGNGTAEIATGPSGDVAYRSIDPQRPPPGDAEGEDAWLVHRVGPQVPSFGGFELAPLAEGEGLLELGMESTLRPAEPAEPGGLPPLACDDPATTMEPLPFQQIDPGDEVRPGLGVLVHTVGLWTNGTSFYTNDAAYHEGPYPKGYGEDWGGSDPLPVYVYDQDPDEIPRRYQEAGYFTTIQGFNEALKGMVVGVDALTYFPGELGYTREGNEDHALYGDDLIFYIEALEVREEPCPVPQPVCDLPKTPNPIPPPVLPTP